MLGAWCWGRDKREVDRHKEQSIKGRNTVPENVFSRDYGIVWHELKGAVADFSPLPTIACLFGGCSWGP